ncbi:hypothetical protein [Endozoicomonas ascidiicola]|uniref:hypothetical protein n=1 Tax=Endozoicomonas ascidiicola TaxID=1698521 RepID=UPI000A5623F1|nr:hypothetical protein [Endozoicomonas ascidiicola]
MPNIPPSGRNSGPVQNDQRMPVQHTEADKKTVNPTPSPHLSESIKNIESKYWHNRLVSFCLKTIQRITQPPKSFLIQQQISSLSDGSDRSKIKVLAALKLHSEKGTKNIPLHTAAQSTIDGSIALSQKTLRKVDQTLQLSSVGIGYEYYRKGKHVPDGYLENLLFPELAQMVLDSIHELKKNTSLTELQQSITDTEIAKKLVITEAEKAGIKKDKDFSFERILELKQGIRNNLVISIEEQQSMSKAVSEIDKLRKNTSNPEPPKLEPPNKTNHFIEKEDRKHIKKLVTQDRFFSWLNIKDAANRTKRMLLRNKLHGGILLFSLAMTAVLSVIFPPAGATLGIAVLTGLGIELAYISFWSGTDSLWQRLRIFIGLKQIKKHSNFKYDTLDPRNDRKRMKLIKELATICKIKNFTHIYNTYAELEKLATKINKIDQKESIKESIKLEKLRALYKKRHKELFSNMLFFDQLRENIIINKTILEDRLRNNLLDIWEEKFSNRPKEELEKIFLSANKKGSLIIHNQEIDSTDKEWLSKTIPFWMKNASTKTSPEDNLKEKILTKQKESFFSGIKKYTKHISRSTIIRQAKKFTFNNMRDLIRNAFKSKPHSAEIVFSHTNPFSSAANASGYSSFVIAFILETLASKANQKINEKRMEEIKSGKKGTTFSLFGSRPRTGREEISTYQALSKNDVEPMIQLLSEAMLESDKINKKILKAKFSAPLNSLHRYDSISDQKAAEFILKFAIWNLLIEKEKNNTVNLFYKDILEKSEKRNSEVSSALKINGKKPLSIKKISIPSAFNYITNIDQNNSSIDPEPFIVSRAIYREQSDVILHRIHNKPSGQLIIALLQKNLTEQQAIKRIHTLDLDELRVLQHWASYASREDSFRAHKAILKKFDRIVAHAIHQRYSDHSHSSPPRTFQRPVDPL